MAVKDLLDSNSAKKAKPGSVTADPQKAPNKDLKPT
jgi:hypothetical protein